MLMIHSIRSHKNVIMTCSVDKKTLVITKQMYIIVEFDKV